MKKLTYQALKEMAPGTMFVAGLIKDSPAGINMANTGKEIKWVAVRGDIADWAIYCDNPYTPQADFKSVASMGDKVQDIQNIQKLVKCTNEVLNAYRH